jgi:hypothetical protein
VRLRPAVNGVVLVLFGAHGNFAGDAVGSARPHRNTGRLADDGDALARLGCGGGCGGIGSSEQEKRGKRTRDDEEGDQQHTAAQSPPLVVDDADDVTIAPRTASLRLSLHCSKG